MSGQAQSTEERISAVEDKGESLRSQLDEARDILLRCERMLAERRSA